MCEGDGGPQEAGGLGCAWRVSRDFWQKIAPWSCVASNRGCAAVLREASPTREERRCRDKC